MDRRFGLGLIVTLAVAMGAVSEEARSVTSARHAYTVAYKLAAIDCKCVPSAARVHPYAEVLAILAGKKCRETKTKIGDMAVVSRRLLARKHVRMSILNVLRGVNRSIPASLGRTRCADIFTLFVTLVERP